MSEQHELMEVDEPCTFGNRLNGRKLTRGEKSKIAAKTRRDKENIAFNDLVSELPICSDVLNRMDKASVIKLATFYIKLKQFLQKDILTSHYKDIPKESRSTLHSLKSSSGHDLDPIEKELKDVEGQMMLDALNGFLIFITRKYSIRFISASVTDHLGLAVENLISKNVSDIIHPCDLSELTKQFMPEGSPEGCSSRQKAITDSSCKVSIEDKSQKVFYLRMKYNMCRAGSKTKQTGFTLVQWSGKLKQHISKKNGTLVTDGLVCICRPMQTSSVMEIRMDGNMFMSRHDLGMTFTFCDSRIMTLIGYEPDELVGKTAYHFHNPIDAPKVSDCHQNLIIKGTSVSKYYRFLGKNDNWVWLQTRATIIYNTTNNPQYIVCMNYVISEEEGERYLMLEEHKHANIHDDNAVVTLPDNHHPTYIFHMEEKPTTGPSIVELEEGNLEKTACLNGELDQPKPSPSSVAPSCKHEGNPQETSRSFRMLLECDKLAETGFYPCENRVSPAMDQVCSGIGQGRSPLQPNNGRLPCFPPLQESNGGLSLQQCIPQQLEHSKGGEPFAVHSVNNSYNGFSPIQNISTDEGAQLNTMSTDPHCLDSGLNKLYTAEACPRPYSHSDDGGYESASSPCSSNISPLVLSPYSAPDIVSERAYTSSTPNGGRPLNADSNPAIIQNCNFGLGYPANNPILDEYESTDMPEAENILDELLQSFGNPSGNLDETIALVFSNIQNLTNQTIPTEPSPVRNPDSANIQDTPVLNSEEKLKDHSKPDKSVLRHILTIPEDRIPKKPVSSVQPPEEFNMDAVKAKAPSPRAEMDERFVKSSRCFKSSEDLKHRLDLSKHDAPSGQRLIDLIIQKILRKKPAEGQGHGIVGQNQGVGESEQLPDESEQLPDDISDFALQYMETTDDDSGYALSDLLNDILMDCTDTDLAGELTPSLGQQCPMRDSNNGQVKVKLMKRHVQSQHNCEQKRKSKKGFPNSTAQSLKYNHKGCYDQPSSSGADCVYGHKGTPAHRGLCNGGVTSNKSVLHRESQTQTSTSPISELEKHLRNAADHTAGENCKSACGEASLLQKLLTGELSKDSYMQMELDRCPRRSGLKPN